MQYAWGTCLFFFTRFLQYFLHDSTRINLHPTVRSQSIRNFVAGSELARIYLEAHCIVYENSRLEVYDEGAISIGESSILGGVHIACRKKITLGKRAVISWNVLIQDYDPHPTSQDLRAIQISNMAAEFFPRYGKKPATQQLDWKPKCVEIYIGDDVWIGANSVILKGSHIGSGSIVATGAVVAGGHFPERSLIGGNPAKLIKELPR